MATDFNKNALSSSGGFKPNSPNTPLDIRTVVETEADILSIPRPFIGMTVYAKDTGKRYEVLTLKNLKVGLTTVKDGAVDTYRELPYASKEYVDEKIQEVIDSGDLGGSGGSNLSNADVLEQITQDHIESWNAKSNFSGNYEDLKGKPTDHVTTGMLGAELSNYATESFVRNEIANAQIGGGSGDVDLSGYATKDELSYKADRTELHQHNNKVALDKIDDARMALWDNKSDFDGDYNSLKNLPDILPKDEIATKEELEGKADKTALDGKADISMLDAKADVSMLDAKADKADMHNHSNKQVLDQIDAAKIAAWDEKSEFSGSYNDLSDKPEIPSLDGYATEDFVAEKIAEAKLEGGDDGIDLEIYITEGELAEALRAKANASDVDSALESKADVTMLDAKADKKDLHSHGNKQVLDALTSEKIAQWDSKSEFTGSYKDLTDTPELFSGSFNDLKDVPEDIVMVDELDEFLDLKADKADLNKKVDKVQGKSLVSDTEIARLANVKNYDDTALQSKVTNLEKNAHAHANKSVLDNIDAAKVASWDEKATTAYVDNKIGDLVAGAPEALNTLKELADALGNNQNSVTTIMSELDKKATKTELQNSVKDLASKDYVSSEIAKAKLEGEEVDLSGFATKDDLKVKANQVDVDNALALKADKTQLHTHANKSVLDKLTDAKIAAWDEKSEFTGSYKDLTDKPEIPSLDGYATENFVSEQIADLVDSAPAALDTLKELAAALGDNPNFATEILNRLGLIEGSLITAHNVSDTTKYPDINI